MIDQPAVTALVATKMGEVLGVPVSADEVRLELNGWRWFATVRDAAIVFVTDEAGAARLAAERAVLGLLKSRVRFAVPVSAYHSQDFPYMDIRRFAPGNTGPEFHQRLLADRELGAKAAEGMARMLAELHGSLTEREASEIGLTAMGHESWSSERIRTALEAWLDKDEISRMDFVLRWRERECRSVANGVLIHGDFGSHNFSFDPQTGLPAGLFDFEGICWNDRHWDFNLLPSYGCDFMTRTIETYRELTGVDIDVRKVRLHHAVYAISNVAWRLGSFPPESSEVVGGLKWVEQALSSACGVS